MFLLVPVHPGSPGQRAVMLSIRNKSDSPIILKNIDLCYMFLLPEMSVSL